MPLNDPIVQFSIARVRAWLNSVLVSGNSTHCPVCDRHTQRYRRSINSSMAFVLVKLVRHFERHPKTKWLHVPNFLEGVKASSGFVATRSQGDWAKLRFWGLIEERDDIRVGYWRPTQAGIDFADGVSVEPRYAYVINNSVVEWSDEKTDIYAALGNKFSYRDICS